MRVRVATSGLIALVLVCGVGFAALRTASDLWFSTLYTMTTVLLLVAVIAARFRRGGERAFWFGFALFGWGFFLLGMGPWANPYEGGFGGRAVNLNRDLLTTKLVHFVVPRVRMGTDDLDEIDGITANTLGIAHLLATLVLATLGGLIAVRMRRRPRGASPVRSLAILLGLILLPALATSGKPTHHPTGFFPESKILGDDGISNLTAVRYSEILDAMGESSLWALSRQGGEATTYRLLWTPSFEHPVCVRIERNTEGARLQTTVLLREGGYDPGEVVIDRCDPLDEAQWRKLESLVDAAKLWDQPTMREEDYVSDGDRLVIEVVKDGRYCLVVRASSDRDYAAACRYMLELTGLKFDKVWAGYHPDGSTPEVDQQPQP